MTPPPHSLTQKVREIVSRTDVNGSPRYSDAEVRDVLALIVMASRADPATLPVGVRAIMGAFALKIGFVAGSGSNALRAAVDTYFISHPPQPELLSELRAVVVKELNLKMDDSTLHRFTAGRIRG